MSDLFMGFDAGTQSVKVAVYDENFQCLAQRSRPTTLRYPRPGWVEMDVDQFLSLAIECARDCVAQLRQDGHDPARVRAIMGDGIICGIAGVDRDGRAITPYINYLDSRTSADAADLNREGREIWARETGNAEASCMFPALFARWLIGHDARFQREGVKFVHNAPYILMRLAGLRAEEAFIDWGAMSGWGLGYRVMDKEWSSEQLRILGIDPGYLPRVLRPWDVVGRLCPEMAEKTGLSTDTMILAGAGDTMQSMLGAGVFEPGRGVDVAGTCSMFCVSTAGVVPELSRPGRALIFNSGSLPDSYFYWGSIRSGGLALRWFKDQFCQRADDAGYYRRLSAGAAAVPPGSRGVIFLPYLTGGHGDQVSASGGFLNLTMDDDQFVAWRAVLEAIGYDYAQIAAAYRAAGVELSRITVTEGGSRDDLWNQIKADILGSTVRRYHAAGGAVLTNCVFAARAAGRVSDIRDALSRIIATDRDYQPDETNVALYRELGERQRRLIGTDLRPAFETLAGMRERLR